jgi:DUF971 family protein
MTEAAKTPVRPKALARNGEDGLSIDWSDGHRGVYTWKELRQHCPCASCREEHTRPLDPFRILTAGELAPRAPLQPLKIEPVGHYAYKIVWNDGHDTGLYTLENLRALCECPECRKQS